MGGLTFNLSKITMALIVEEKNFSHILRILNTNVDGKLKVIYALTAIKGIGRRFADIVCKRADVDVNCRAGELTKKQLQKICVIIANPKQHNIPDHFLNRRRDRKTNKDNHIHANQIAQKWREDFDEWKKTRRHRGLRHLWQLKTRGQHTKTSGRGVSITAFHLGIKT